MHLTTRKCFAALSRLRKNEFFLPRETKLLLVKNLVFPHFEYCPAPFLGLTDEFTTKLDRCRNAALRFVEGIKRHHHISSTYKKYGIASYRCRLSFLTLNLLATTLRSNTPFYLLNHFKFQDTEGPGSKRASALDLCNLKFGTETSANSFRVGAAQLWNELPKDIRELHKAKYPPSTFKAHLALRVAAPVASATAPAVLVSRRSPSPARRLRLPHPLHRHRWPVTGVVNSPNKGNCKYIMSVTKDDLFKYLETQQRLLIKLKLRFLKETFSAEDIYDFELILKSNKKTIDQIFCWSKSIEEDKAKSQIQLILIDNIAIIESLFHILSDWTLQLEVSDETESLADTVLITSSFNSDEDD
ncbi:hypothetical protein TSAR_009993 [Trichomalopsis sarcophagae]|uniref:Uncharacterized protein n=1 Tax=Trichomalopsis sarcophagae TaxID=543379 RepID=A0A232FBG2_9HYME|nr:hypothetical protein TSAR_009993 [Trichomalopsis sarcophagae]